MHMIDNDEQPKPQHYLWHVTMSLTPERGFELKQASVTNFDADPAKLKVTVNKLIAAQGVSNGSLVFAGNVLMTRGDDNPGYWILGQMDRVEEALEKFAKANGGDVAGEVEYDHDAGEWVARAIPEPKAIQAQPLALPFRVDEQVDSIEKLLDSKQIGD